MLKKPIYTGFSVLDLSKVLMNQFHYDYILPKYGVDRVKLLFTDTDNLTYFIYTGDIYKDMKEDQHLFDTSYYPKDHFLYSIENKKVIGKFKDENAGSPVMDFVGLRSKMYAMQIWYERDAKSKEKKTAKGVKKSVMEKELTHELYRKCLFTKTSQTHAMMGSAPKNNVYRET